MKKAETRRVVPISTITLICIVVLSLFQMVFLFGAYEIKTTTVKSSAPWFYWTFRRLVGETAANRRSLAIAGTEEPSTDFATVAGFKPEELSIQIEDVENPVLETKAPDEGAPDTVIPASQPEAEPVDENEPVG
jgi:hypothetical protein